VHDSVGDSLRESMSEAPRLAGGHTLVASLTSEEGLKAFVREVGEALDVSLVDIWAFAGEREALVYEAVWHRGGGVDSQAAVGTWVPLEERPDLRAVIETAAPVERHLDDPGLPEELRAFLTKRGYRSSFDLPLRAAGETIGVLGVVETRLVRRLSAHDRELLERMCDLAALGVQTAWARRREAEREAQLHVLLDASRSLAGSLDHGAALQRVSAAIESLLVGIGHESSIYLRRDDGSFGLAGSDGKALPATDPAAATATAVTIDGEPDSLAKRALGRGRPAQARTAAVPTRLVVPLIGAGEPQGFVDVRGRPLRRFATDETMLLQVLANQAAAAYTHARAGRAAGRQAAVDTMTGFFNRWYFYDRLFSETARAYRYKQPLSVVLVGVDRFDEYLHRRGRADANAVLKAIARLLTASLRNKVDVACVHADGEFGLLLPNTPPFKPGAALVGQRLRRAVEKMEFRDEDHDSLGRFTVSVGVAGYPRHADDADELGVLVADALADARAHGGNRVHVHGAPPAAYGPESEDDEEPDVQGAGPDGAGSLDDPIDALIRPPDWDDYGDEDDLPLTADHTGRGDRRADRLRQDNLDTARGGPGPSLGRPHGSQRPPTAVDWVEDGDT